MELATQLKKSELFFGIDDKSIKTLISHLDPNVITYKKGEYIAFEGDDLGERFGVITEGSVEVSLENATGSKTIINIFSEGDLLAEVAAFADKEKWPSTVLALDDTTIVFFEVDTILKTCNKACSCHTTLIKNLLKIISTRALYLNKKVQYLAAKGIKEKIAFYLLDQYRAHYKNLTFTVPLSRNQMADFLNVTRPSLSREMANLKDQGILDYHRSTIKILDINALSNILE